MFQPFSHISEFYPGLFLWCDPYIFGHKIARSLPAGEEDRRLRPRDLRPCMVISVNHDTLTFTAAPLSATRPAIEPERWTRIDNPPFITWKLNDAWIWVATPPTISMVLDDARIMHPNKDVYYSMDPVSATNLQNYWVHRQAYMKRSAEDASCRSSTSTYHQPAYVSNSSYYSNSPTASVPSPSSTSSGHGRYVYPAMPSRSSAQHRSSNSNSSSGSGSSGSSYYSPSQTPIDVTIGFTTLSPHPVVIPPGFTEALTAHGWYRNPTTGWLWHGSRGLVAPTGAAFSHHD